jgi:hypothetical protein
MNAKHLLEGRHARHEEDAAELDGALHAKVVPAITTNSGACHETFLQIMVRTDYLPFPS